MTRMGVSQAPLDDCLGNAFDQWCLNKHTKLELLLIPSILGLFLGLGVCNFL
jgi:hypothetical protein